MATNIFNYNGTLLTTVADGTIDAEHASIKFPGKGFINYGEPVNENMLWIMQNFAATYAPSTPLMGQIWYDSTNEILKVYNGSSWISSAGIILSATAPVSGTNAGALWFNTTTNQLNVWNGSSWLLVGPLGSSTNADPINPAPPSNSLIDAIRLSDGTTNHPAWRMSIGGTSFAIISKDSTYSPSPAITGFSSINPGLNFNSTISGSGVYSNTNYFSSAQTNLPSTDNTYNLGSSSFKFANIYSQNEFLYGNLTVNGTSVLTTLNVSGSTQVANIGVATAPDSNWPIKTNGNVQIGQTFSQVSTSNGIFQLTNLSNATYNQKIWGRSTIDGMLSEYIADDNGINPHFWLTVDRAGDSVSNITLWAGSNTPVFQALNSGNVVIVQEGASLVFGDGTSMNSTGPTTKATTGYQQLPSGVIIQWGVGNTGGVSNIAQSFPIEFPHACTSVVISEDNAAWDSTGPTISAVSSRTQFGFNAWAYILSEGNWVAGSINFNWIATGY